MWVKILALRHLNEVSYMYALSDPDLVAILYGTPKSNAFFSLRQVLLHSQSQQQIHGKAFLK